MIPEDAMTPEGPTRFRLLVQGADAVELLHRVTSQDVRGLSPGAKNRQCLLNARGKIVAFFTLERLPDGAILEGPLALASTVRETIERYIITEDVRVEASAAPSPCSENNDERIRAGIPRWGAEIDRDTIPLEAGMNDYVSTTKGCYTGQETIARIETYGQVARRISRMESVGSRERPKLGVLYLGDREVGRVTSVTEGVDALGNWQALGMVQRAALDTRVRDAGVRLVGEDGATWNVMN